MSRTLPIAAVFIASLAIAVSGQYSTGAYTSDLHWADEGSHYINGLLIHDYIAHGLMQNPIVFATGYYEHYPKVAIGHWPPFFHPLEALFLFIAGPSTKAALFLQALFAAALATAVATVAARFHGWLTGALAALITLLAPDVLSGIDGVMLDVPLALFAFLATLCWAKYLESRNWRWSLAFALSASAAILTKGNGFYLALVPPLSLLILQRAEHARHLSFWLPLPVVGLLTIPWYVATYKIAADGFNYTWGLHYSAIALGVYGRVLFVLIGVPGFLVAAAGAVRVLVRHDNDWENALGAAVLSSMVAGVAYHCIVPVALEPRYLTPLVPDFVVLTVFALRWPLPTRRIAVATGAAALLLVAAEAKFFFKPDLGMARAARLIVESHSSNPLVLVGSTPGGEGAITAEMASDDRGGRDYVLRGFEVLGNGNFMGTRYAPRFSSPAALKKWVETTRIGWIVLDTTPDSLKWKHNAQLRDLLLRQPAGWQELAELHNSRGTVLVYRTPSSSASGVNAGALLPQLMPAKVIGRYHPQ